MAVGPRRDTRGDAGDYIAFWGREGSLRLTPANRSPNN